MPIARKTTRPTRPTRRSGMDLTPGECARLMGCGLNTVYKAIRLGLLTGYRLPLTSHRRVKPLSVHKWLVRNGLAVPDWLTDLIRQQGQMPTPTPIPAHESDPMDAAPLLMTETPAPTRLDTTRAVGKCQRVVATLSLLRDELRHLWGDSTPAEANLIQTCLGLTTDATDLVQTVRAHLDTLAALAQPTGGAA